jgi:hypothetical protein
MSRTLSLSLLALAGLLGVTAPCPADVIVRTPRVRVVVGPVVACGLGVTYPAPRFVGVYRVPPSVVVTVAQPPVVVPAQPPVIVPAPPMPAPAPAGLPPGTVVLPPGTVAPAPAPAPVVLTPAPPMTHQEFARIFKPLPGKYEVVLIHPGSKRPVNVCFTLPDGCPRVVVHHRELVFDYGRHHEVAIRFALGGRVRVITR